MEEFLTGAAVLVVIGFFLVMALMNNAPEGYQDDKGYHKGKEDPEREFERINSEYLQNKFDDAI